MNVGVKELDVVSAVLVEARVVIPVADLDMVKCYIVGPHHLDYSATRVHWTFKHKAGADTWRALESYVRHARRAACTLIGIEPHVYGPFDDGYLPAIIRKRDAIVVRGS